MTIIIEYKHKLIKLESKYIRKKNHIKVTCCIEYDLLKGCQNNKQHCESMYPNPSLAFIQSNIHKYFCY